MREKGKQQRAERHVPVPVGHAWQRTPRTGNTLCRSERGERGEAFVGMCHVYLGQSMVHLSGPTNSLSNKKAVKWMAWEREWERPSATRLQIAG
jgi:hypothetical protein